MIRVRGLCKRRGGRTLLDDVSLTFDRGEAVSIIGPSGSGKTTLLRCLNGLEEIDAGAVEVGGHVLEPGAARRLHRRELAAVRQRLGMVFQTWNLFAHRTALGNVIEAPVHVRGEALDEATRRAHALLDRVGLAGRHAAWPHELSGGEQQRVAIARALAMAPDGLLLDEPTSALDPARTGGLAAMLRELAQGGLTIVVATHEMAFARRLSSRVVVLVEGRVVEEGTAAQVLGDPRHAGTRALLGLEGAEEIGK